MKQISHFLEGESPTHSRTGFNLADLFSICNFFYFYGDFRTATVLANSFNLLISLDFGLSFFQCGSFCVCVCVLFLLWELLQDSHRTRRDK